MKNRKGFFSSYFTLYIILLMLLVVNTAILALVDFKYMLISSVISVFACGLVVYRVLRIQAYSKKLINSLKIEAEQSSSLLSNFSFSVIYTSQSGEIIWYNDSFKKYLSQDDCLGSDISYVLGIDNSAMLQKGRAEITFSDREFTVFCSTLSSDFVLYYLIDNTRLKKIAKEYVNTRPVVMMLAYDNFTDVLRNSRDSERTSFKSAIHKEVEGWLSDIPCIITNNSSHFLVILEEKHLENLSKGKFSILDSVRKLSINDLSGITISIGVGRGGRTLSECENLCIQALEMAQSRGGDQAAIKSPDVDYKFFGGMTNAFEKKNKVKARVVSSAIKETFAAADKIIFMGHRFSDLDCLGAAFGMSRLASFMKKPSYILFNKERTLAKSLYESIAQTNSNIFIDDKTADEFLTDRTLLVILDTHRPSFLEYSEVYEKCKNVIVIDHHRKSVDAIDNALVFYHETATSSTCEMVAEILQYVEGFKLDKLGSEALLGGIVLDSKNLCLHTGVRTFEACAYLKDCGADTVAVKKFFADNMDTHNRKSKIISESKTYMDCAISKDEEGDSITRIAASQAADELLNFENINASFVMSRIYDEINISARSLGSINVQLIMESLGGGGHKNMAACQLKCTDFDEAYNILVKAIDDYKSNL